MRTRNAAIIKISKKLLLEGLGFEGGTIHRVYEPDDYLEHQYFCIVLEHPDLPRVPVNERLLVTPTYQSYCDERGSLLKVERINPTKREGGIIGG